MPGLPPPYPENFASGELSLNVPVGSHAYIGFEAHAPSTGAWQANGPFTWGEGAELATLLGYIQEIWQSTVGYEMVRDLDAEITFEATTQVDIDKHDLRKLILEFDDPPVSGQRLGTNVQSYDIGYCQFNYSGFKGPLRPIRWLTQKLLPEYPGCNGASLYFREPMSGAYSVYGFVGSPPSVTTNGANKIAPSQNDIAGKDAINNEVTNTLISVGGNFTLPKLTGDALGTLTLTGVAFAYDFIRLIGSGAVTTSLFAYVADIWAYSQAKGKGTSGGVLETTPDNNMYSAGGGWMIAAKMHVAGLARDKSTNWRFSPLQYFGAWAPVFNGALGELRYLNNRDNILVPEGIGATGIWVYLKPGFTGSIEFVTTANLSPGIDTPNGHVSFLDGAIDGLLWGPP